MDRDQELIEIFSTAWKEGAGVIAYTSGSTGNPKAIELRHSHLRRSALRTNRFFNIDCRSHLHSAISFEFIGGKMMIARSLAADCKLSWQHPSMTPVAPADTVTLMSVVPAQMLSVINRKEEFRNVGTFLIGGAAISPELWREISNSGLRAYESYGMTETASHIAVRLVVGEAPCESLFYPLPGIDLSLACDGCLIIKDEDVSVKTNDIAEIHADGGFFIKGRKDDMIVTGGKKVLPQDIEAVLSANIDFCGNRFMISSKPHPVWTNEIVLVIENSPHDLIPVIRHNINNLDEMVLPRWQRPKKIITIPSLPLSSSGKPLRRFLRNYTQLS